MVEELYQFEGVRAGVVRFHVRVRCSLQEGHRHGYHNPGEILVAPHEECGKDLHALSGVRSHLCK